MGRQLPEGPGGGDGRGGPGSLCTLYAIWRPRSAAGHGHPEPASRPGGPHHGHAAAWPLRGPRYIRPGQDEPGHEKDGEMQKPAGQRQAG